MSTETPPLFEPEPTPAAEPTAAQPPAPTRPTMELSDFRKLLRPVDHLPADGDLYQRMRRRAADPIGMAGLPNTRAALDDLVVELCQRLWSAGTDYIPGHVLAQELRLTGGTRSLRELCAYSHVHHRIRAIVGVPGSGYVWGPNDDRAYTIMQGQARQMGRCYFFLCALYGHGTPAVEAAQMLLDFVDVDGGDRRENPDDLATLMQAEGVHVDQVLSAIIDRLSETDDGRRVLHVIGQKHQSVLVSAAALGQAEQAMQQALAMIQSARRQAG